MKPRPRVLPKQLSSPSHLTNGEQCLEETSAALRRNRAGQVRSLIIWGSGNETHTPHHRASMVPHLSLLSTLRQHLRVNDPSSLMTEKKVRYRTKEKPPVHISSEHQQ
eukprot:scaffold44379_cov78-Cyclotella_meneghiniana.AAC.6